MERAELVQKIRKIIVSAVNHENFEMNDTLTASKVSGWDSLSHMVIITEIEDEFKIKFKLKELNKLNNLGSLLELVKSKLEESK